jgi:hypothetical protein
MSLEALRVETIVSKLISLNTNEKGSLKDEDASWFRMYLYFLRLV